MPSLYAAQADTSWDSVYRWKTSFHGKSVLQNVQDDGSPGGCAMPFHGPISDSMSSLRQNAFGTASYNATDRQTIEARQLRSQVVCKS
jgi:hypothetical protein